MAGEIQISYGVTGKTLYFIVRNSLSLVWNTAGTPAFEAFNASNITDYDTALVEDSTSMTYIGTFPTGINTAGVYRIEVRERAGGSPALTDSIVGAAEIEWSGTAQTTLASRAVAGDAMTLTTTERGNTADKILNRNIGGGSDGGERTVKNALRPSINRVEFDVPVSGKFSVYAEDDTTVAWVGSYTRGANNLGPIISADHD